MRVLVPQIWGLEKAIVRMPKSWTQAHTVTLPEPVESPEGAGSGGGARITPKVRSEAHTSAPTRGLRALRLPQERVPARMGPCNASPPRMGEAPAGVPCQGRWR